MNPVAVPMGRYEAVIWDWNGTLFDDAGLCVEVMNGLLAERGLPRLTPERYTDTFRFPSWSITGRWASIFRAIRLSASAPSSSGGYERRRLECRLQAGARETIETLGRAGVRQSLLSAYRQDSLLELIAHFGLTPWFSDVTGNDDVYATGSSNTGGGTWPGWAASRTGSCWSATRHTTRKWPAHLARTAGSCARGTSRRARLSTCGVPCDASLRDFLAWTGLAAVRLSPAVPVFHGRAAAEADSSRCRRRRCT